MGCWLEKVVNPWQAEGERADEEVWELGMQESLGNVDIDGRNLKQPPKAQDLQNLINS